MISVWNIVIDTRMWSLMIILSKLGRNDVFNFLNWYELKPISDKVFSYTSIEKPAEPVLVWFAFSDVFLCLIL